MTPRVIAELSDESAVAFGLVASQPERAHRGLAWMELPWIAQLYVAAVIIAGTSATVALFPRTFPRPGLWLFLLAFACVTSLWKVNLPISKSSG